MKKILIFVVAVVSIVPQVVMAAWWNPFTWKIFSKSAEVRVEQVNNTVMFKENIKVEELVDSSTSTASEISLLKKEIDALKAKNNSTKPQTQTTKIENKKATKNSDEIVSDAEPLKIEKPLTVFASENPAKQCLSIKKSWDTFDVALLALDKQMSSVLISYNDLAFGTANRPIETSALFTYNYTRLTTGKTKFSAQVNDIRKLIDSLPRSPQGTNNDFQKIKDNYLNSLIYLENSYEMALQAFKVFGEDKDGYISLSEINTSESLFNDSIDEYNKVNPLLKNSGDIVSQFQFNLQQKRGSDGCSFTFYTDRTIETTIDEEKLFTQQVPKSTATANNATLVSVKTRLPIVVNDDGQEETVLKLVCNGENRPVTRIDEDTVGNLMGKSYYPIWVNCHFVYSGNGNELSTRVADFNW